MADWIGRQREALVRILAGKGVKQIIVGYGEPSAGARCDPRNQRGVLQDDWLMALLRNGEMQQPRKLAVGGGLGNDRRVLYRDDHNDHNHFDIDDR